MRREAMGGSRFLNVARLFFSPSNQLVARFLDARKLKDIRNKLDAIAKDQVQFGSIVPVPTVSQTQVWSAQATQFGIIPDMIVGRDGDKDIIINMLTDNSGDAMTSQTLFVASIGGIGGMGKTTLARYVYNDDKVKSSFDVRFWIDVTQDFDVKDILEKILASAMNEHPFISEMKYHDPYEFHHFIRAIAGKKFLLILDNVWDVPDLRLKWLQLESLLKEGAFGSKVLITTRNQNVPKIMDSESPHMLENLAEEDSWFLFQQIALTRWHEPDVEIIGKDIVKMCPNVPLVIRSIGSFLAGQYTVQEWQAFRDNQFARFSSYGRNIIQSLKLSYDQLDKRLKLCVNYCIMIPKGSDFVPQEMIHCWIALGYIESFDENQSLEEKGKQYMSILLNTGFLKVSEESNYRFIPDTFCRMHDVMYDLVHSLVGSHYKVANLYTDEFDKKVHHVSFNLVRNSASLWEVPSSFFKVKHLQSFIMFNERHVLSTNNVSVKNWTRCYKLVSNFHCLRSLDLSRLEIKELPTSLGELISLRLLNFSYTSIEKLPNSITRLSNLQSLYLNDCEDLQELPKDMRKLVKLRHLKLYSYDSKLTHMPLGLGTLTDLRTLDMFIVGKQSAKCVGKLTELNNLNNLEGSLTIKVRESKDAESEANATNIEIRDKLENLSIEFAEYGTREDEMLLQGLQPPANLKSLGIKGYGGERFPYWMIDDQLQSFLPNLVAIELTYCENCKTICSMGRLLHLKVLILSGLDNVEYIENNIGAIHSVLPYTPLFPSLESLTMRDMPKLKGCWSSDCHVEHLIKWDFAFPKLKKLSVSNVELAITISGPPLTGFKSLQQLHIFPLTRQRPQAPIVFNSIFPNLNRVTLWRCNDLKVLPKALRSLSSVETLDIWYGEQLKEIPEWIDNLTSLNTLDISNCPRLESLPPQIRNIVSLKKLIIEDCPILAERCQMTTANRGVLALYPAYS